MLRVRFYDLSTQQPLWSSEPISLPQVAAAGRPAADFLAGLLRKVDEEYIVAPMPARDSAWIKSRLKNLSAGLSAAENSLPALCEIRCYEGQKLLTGEEAAVCYDRVMGNGKGRILAAGTVDERRSVVDQWLQK